LKTVFYTSGISGSGRLVRGIALGNALKRKKIESEFSIVNSSRFAYLCDQFEINHFEVPLENAHQLSKTHVENSRLYKTITDLNPDILVIDMLWHSLYNFIDELKCKKIFICHNVIDTFFSVEVEDERLTINPDQYDLLLAIEPFSCGVPMKEINPLVLRNRDEIFSKDDAISTLGLEKDEEICLYAFNNHPGDFDRYRKKYSHLEDVYRMVYTSNYKGGIFPVVDYFNAIDYIVCAASYNIFWEVIFFQKEASFENIASVFSSTEYRIDNYQDFLFDENGADQLVDIMMNV
jgi:hypothetical protein